MFAAVYTKSNGDKSSIH